VLSDFAGYEVDVGAELSAEPRAKLRDLT